MNKIVKIATWNVNGIRANHDKGLSQFVQEQRPDILCLQETKAHKEQVEPAKRSLGFEFDYWSSAERKGYSGVATFLKEKRTRNFPSPPFFFKNLLDLT